MNVNVASAGVTRYLLLQVGCGQPTFFLVQTFFTIELKPSTMGINVLFIYPNTYGMNMLPPAIALFSSLLRENGHSVQLFDATYYSTDHGIDSDGSKAEHLNVVEYDMDNRGIKMKTTNWVEDIRQQMRTFAPDLIAVSSTEDMWDLAIRLLEGIEDDITGRKTPVLAGGVFPTFAPAIAISHRLVDMVCVG